MSEVFGLGVYFWSYISVFFVLYAIKQAVDGNEVPFFIDAVLAAVACSVLIGMVSHA